MDIAALEARVGEHLGTSAWLEVGQDRIDAFADATGDHQWIHRAGPEADAGPFGGPIAHGFLTLSLLSRLTASLPPLVPDAVMGINYGLDRVRFITPVPAGARIRASVVLKEVASITNGVQVTNAVTIEMEGAERPAAYVESLVRLYG